VFAFLLLFQCLHYFQITELHHQIQTMSMLYLPKKSAWIPLVNETQPLRDPSMCDWAWDHESTACIMAGKRAIQRIGKIIREQSFPPMKIMEVGVGYGQHNLVDWGKLHRTCIFYSFGIENDYTFDTDLNQKKNCKGYLFDPTVSHVAKFPGEMLFFHLGHSMLDKPIDCFSDRRRVCNNLAEWTLTSPPQIMKLFQHPRIHVLKMDCEGCEFSLAQAVAKYDPDFFTKVDQLAIEVHIHIWQLKGEEELRGLGLLYHMLHKAGLEFVHMFTMDCGDDPNTPSYDGLTDLGYPCEPKSKCHNYLISKNPTPE